MKEPMEITREECSELLSAGVIGRLAFVTPAGPHIVPLNYATLGDAIVVRTTPYSEVARFAVDADVAFEVDELNHQRQTGWSIVAVGRLEEMSVAELQELRTMWVPRPWAGGLRNVYLRLAWKELTGRRLREELATTVPQRPLP